MRTLKEIEKDLAEARSELSNVEGSTAEVYSRIVGYYRSVRNWNKGKREEYGERKMFNPESSAQGTELNSRGHEHVLLFVRGSCPACPGAKDAAGKLGIPVSTVNADTEEGLQKAANLGVMSTPTAILYSGTQELKRARDSAAIAALSSLVREKAAS